VNTLLNEGGPQSTATLQAIEALYRSLGRDVLGIIPDTVEQNASAEREEGLIRLLVNLRSEARANRNWAQADQIRNQLSELGVVLEDRTDETIWKIVG
jgi:cysteinyl-tRNA synthetase